MKVRELVTKLGYDIDENKLSRYDQTVTNIKSGMKVLAGIGAAVFGTAAYFIKGAADVEQLQIALETMTGSAEKAKKLYSEMADAAAKTPFELGDYTTAGKKLLAFGENAENVVPTLKRVGDVASGLSVPLGDLAEIYGKARVQQTLYAEDLNQLAGRGVPIFTELAKVLGINADQVKKFGSEGKIKFEHLQKAFENMTNEGGMFFNAMINQSKSMGGLMSNIFDWLYGIRVEIGMELLPEAKELAKQFLEWASANKEVIKQNIVGFIKGVASAAKFLFEGLKIGFSIISSLITVVQKLLPFVAALTTAFVAYKGTLIAIQAIEWIKYLWMMRDVIMKAAKAQWVFNFAVSANPLALFIASIMGAIALIIAFKDEIMEFFDTVGSFFDLTQGNLNTSLDINPSQVAGGSGVVNQQSISVKSENKITIPEGTSQQQKKFIDKEIRRVVDEENKKLARNISQNNLSAELT